MPTLITSSDFLWVRAYFQYKLLYRLWITFAVKQSRED